MNGFENMLREVMTVRTTQRTMYDDCESEKEGCKKARVKMDGVAGGEYTVQAIQLQALNALQEWVETDEEDLEDGETLADRLIAMMIGVADWDKDGELTEDEQGIIDVAMNAAWDYMTDKGVSEEDCDALFNDADEDAAERIRDLLADSIPEGNEADEEIDRIVFTDEDQEPLLDSVAEAAYMDAVYRKTFAIRNGKKTRINKRVSGKVRLSAKQKAAIRKAQKKAHSASAMMRRMKSMRLRRKAGL